MSRLKWLGLEALFLGGLALLAVAIFALPGCSEPAPPGGDSEAKGGQSLLETYRDTLAKKKMARGTIACTDPEAWALSCDADCPAGEV